MYVDYTFSTPGLTMCDRIFSCHARQWPKRQLPITPMTTRVNNSHSAVYYAADYDRRYTRYSTINQFWLISFQCTVSLSRCKLRSSCLEIAESCQSASSPMAKHSRWLTYKQKWLCPRVSEISVCDHWVPWLGACGIQDIVTDVYGRVKRAAYVMATRKKAGGQGSQYQSRASLHELLPLARPHTLEHLPPFRYITTWGPSVQPWAFGGKFTCKLE